MLKNYFLKLRSIRFLPVEKITFLYILISAILIFIINPGFQTITELILCRIIVILIVFCLAILNSYKDWKTALFARYIFLGGMLSIWYPETFDINKVLPNLDYILAGCEQKIFGFQPAMVFSHNFTQQWISEILNMGYLAYYPIIIGSSIYFYLKNPLYFRYFFFSVLLAFYTYYLIFILFPTAGPQYYFCVDGFENVKNGVFQQIGTYFSQNSHLICVQPNNGFFLRLVETTQLAGERPTAAFPSSHVGISTLILIHIFKQKYHFLFVFLIPIYTALVLATVYIQAHYVIDVIAGLATAFLFYWLSKVVYNRYFQL